MTSSFSDSMSTSRLRKEVDAVEKVSIDEVLMFRFIVRDGDDDEIGGGAGGNRNDSCKKDVSCHL